MGLTKYEGAVVICKEITDQNHQMWETPDGEFAVWLTGIDRKKNAKLGDRGLLHYHSLSQWSGLWFIKDDNG